MYIFGLRKAVIAFLMLTVNILSLYIFIKLIVLQCNQIDNLIRTTILLF